VTPNLAESEQLGSDELRFFALDSDLRAPVRRIGKRQETDGCPSVDGIGMGERRNKKSNLELPLGTRGYRSEGGEKPTVG
jgi:hypothetical protein